jgi:hypothetical protein
VFAFPRLEGADDQASRGGDGMEVHTEASSSHSTRWVACSCYCLLIAHVPLDTPHLRGSLTVWFPIKKQWANWLENTLSSYLCHNAGTFNVSGCHQKKIIFITITLSSSSHHLQLFPPSLQEIVISFLLCSAIILSDPTCCQVAKGKHQAHLTALFTGDTVKSVWLIFRPFADIFMVHTLNRVAETGVRELD